MALPNDDLLAYMLKRGSSLKWGNVANLSEGAFKELGFVGAYDEARRPSERRASSGMTEHMTRKERQEHYRRKAVLEAKKEAERRAVWVRRHPGAPEANWVRREAARKTRKAGERAARKTARRRTSSRRQ
jgi:nucleotide-binding universal stress UspA family protein